MANGLKVKVKATGKIKPPNLDRGPLTKIGNTLVDAQKKRWAAGLNAAGNPAKPLGKRYFYKKKHVRHVENPIRDMYLTGMTRENFSLRKANDGVIRAENSTRATRQRARQSQQAEEMIGFAGSDQKVLFAGAQEAYGQYLKHAWVPVNG